MNRKPYTTDLTDEQWSLVAPLLPPPRPRGRRPSVDRRRVFDAILYQAKHGCTWEDLPRDFPNDSTVYAYFERWRDDGTLAAVYEALHRRWRRENGRDEDPSAGSLDSRSVHAAAEAARRGGRAGEGPEQGGRTRTRGKDPNKGEGPEQEGGRA